MESRKFKWKFFLLFIATVIVLFFLTARTPMTCRSITKPSAECPLWISEDSITSLDDTKHLLVSAFTVCMSNLFGDYNNVLQLLGVNRVVIYNTSCGPDLDRLLQSYSQEGFVEIVPWPIDQHLNPSRGWLFSEHGGDVHYFGQLTTLNECVYRSMDRSRYVLLNDIDEIVMPYQHDNLQALMDMLQKQHQNVGVFLIENHMFSKIHYNESIHGPLARWNGVPGFNILENIYREEVDRKVSHPYKMILQPRSVEQTSVHAVLKSSGRIFKVPPDVCRVIHSPIRPTVRRLRRIHLDTRLWDFGDELSRRVSGVLRRSGLLSSEEQS